MSELLTPRRVEATFWLLLCGSLATGIGYQTDWGRRLSWPIQTGASAPAAFTEPTLPEPFRLPAADTYLETALRPIFVVTRRPAPAQPEVEPPKPSMNRGQFTLTGTTIVPEGKFAYLLEKAGNKVRVVGEGKEINGIQIKTIEATRVVLTQYDEEEELVLRPTKPPAPPPGTQPPTAAPPSPANAVMPPRRINRVYRNDQNPPNDPNNPPAEAPPQP